MPTAPHHDTFSRLPYASNGWHGWIRSDWQNLPAFQNLDAWLRDPDADVIIELLCRSITRHNTPKGRVYAKYMRARNDGVIKNRELFSCIRWTLLPSRGQRIFSTCLTMLNRGHFCPEPILGARHRGTWGYPHELFVSAELIQPTIEELIQKHNDDMRDKILVSCAQELSRFHQDHFVHGDFLPRNACLELSSKRLYYLDNDRTRLWPCPPPFHCQRRNLAQFCYNLLLQAGHYDLAMPTAFLQAYVQARGWPEKRRQAECNRVIAQITARWQRYGEKEAARLKQSANQA